MRDPFPWPPEGTPEEVVRRHLDAQARADGAAQGDAVLRRVYDRMAAEAPRPATLPLPARRSGWRASLAAGLVAAGLVIGVLFVAQPAALASPAQLVEEAIEANRPEADRCYLLQVQALGDDGRPTGPVLRQGYLWTRGDRYRIDGDLPENGSLGQDEQHRIWIASTREEGSRFDPDEVPANLALVSDMRTLRMDLLLDQLQRGFLLRWDDAPGTFPGARRIHGRPRTTRHVFGIQSVQLEVEQATGIVRQVVVERVRPLTHSRVRLTLKWIVSKPRPDSFYHLESALEPGAIIHGRGDAKRDHLLRAFLRRSTPPAAP
jgi:hypothetical protein